MYVYNHCCHLIKFQFSTQKKCQNMTLKVFIACFLLIFATQMKTRLSQFEPNLTVKRSKNKDFAVQLLFYAAL